MVISREFCKEVVLLVLFVVFCMLLTRMNSAFYLYCFAYNLLEF